MKILCVDDEPEILKLLRQFFDLLGHSMVAANNGQEGWEIFSAAPEDFDILVTDERMPNMSGRDLVKRIRAQGYSLPVIIASGNLDAEMDESVQDLQVTAIISKPFSLAKLSEILADCAGMTGRSQ